MINLAAINQAIQNIDYSWAKPETYVVLIPGLSLIVQKIQLATTLPLNNNPSINTVRQADAQARKFTNICKWHLRGSMTQLVAAMIAIKFISKPVFLLLSLVATYELLDTLWKSLDNKPIHFEFYPDGKLKSWENLSACTIF